VTKTQTTDDYDEITPFASNWTLGNYVFFVTDYNAFFFQREPVMFFCYLRSFAHATMYHEPCRLWGSSFYLQFFSRPELGLDAELRR